MSKEDVNDVSLELIKAGNHDDNFEQMALEERYNSKKDSVAHVEVVHDERKNWNTKAEYLFATLGFSVGFGNLWRFPYLCQKNGGGWITTYYNPVARSKGAFFYPQFWNKNETYLNPQRSTRRPPSWIFIRNILFILPLGAEWMEWRSVHSGIGAFLIPYFLSLILLGIPLFFLELAIGQRIRKGPIGVWKAIHPYLGGVGIASAVVCLLISMYYNMILGWCFFYLFGSFQDPLPYSSCPLGPNCTVNEGCNIAGRTQYFWYTKAIGASSSIADMGDFQWHLCLVLILAWIVLFLFVNRGVQSAGKAVYVTALMPYIVLAIFFGRAVALKGSVDGIKHMFKPEFSRLANGVVWLEAATQVFFSVGVGFGTLIAMSSYNPIHNNCRRDAIFISLADSFTSVFASLVVFSVLGFQAHNSYDECLAIYGGVNNTNLLATGMTLEQKCHNLTYLLSKTFQGPGLTFIAFTEAILKLPVPPLWSVLFFCMLLSLGLGSMFGILEGVLNPLHEQKMIRVRKEILTAVTCVVCVAVGLLFCQRSGEYWLQMFDSFTGTLPLLFICFFELIGVSWVYGSNRFEDDIEFMIRVRPGWFWKITWKFVSPLIVLAIFVSSLVNMGLKPMKYTVWKAKEAESESVEYPTWSYPIIVFLICSSCLCIPAVFFFRLFQRLLTKRKRGSEIVQNVFESSH